MATDFTSETAIFERIVLPSSPEFTAAAARSILEIRFSSEDQDQMQILAEKARAGTLTAQEEQAIDNYERVGHYLAILQSKARSALQSASQSGS